MRIALVSAAGLSVELVHRGAAGPLLATGPSRQAALQCSFPCLPAIVEHTIWSGAPALRHGVMSGVAPPRGRSRLAQLVQAASGPQALTEFNLEVDGEAWTRARLTLATRTAATDPWLIAIQDDSILHAARTHGLDSVPHREAAARLCERLRTVIGVMNEGDALLAHGGPPLSPVRRTVDIRSLPMECSWRCEGRLAQTILPVGVEFGALRDLLLRTDGVARVLRGRALELWNADPAAGLVVVAEPDRSFEDHRADCGDRAEFAAQQGVLMAWGSQGGRPWPPQLHDFRIAPSIAARMGLEWSEPWDSPFDL